jgi:hypothetical protein
MHLRCVFESCTQVAVAATCTQRIRGVPKTGVYGTAARAENLSFGIPDQSFLIIFSAAAPTDQFGTDSLALQFLRKKNCHKSRNLWTAPTPGKMSAHLCGGQMRTAHPTTRHPRTSRSSAPIVLGRRWRVRRIRSRSARAIGEMRAHLAGGHARPALPAACHPRAWTPPYQVHEFRMLTPDHDANSS